MSHFDSSASGSGHFPTWDDAALVQALAAGSEGAFREVYERYWLVLFKAAWRKLNDREAAQEVVQEVFEALWQKREATTIEQLPSYLHTAVKYRVINFLRADYHRRHYLTIGKEQQTGLDSSTEQTLAANDLAQALAASVDRLPEHTREVFRLSRTEHQSVPEIAERLNLSPKTVEYHITRALKLLRIQLRDFLVLLLMWYL